ncbi:MAG TPA: hypothetical protein DIU35_11735, partial [Candidatus Latescibacteria bacterium]|nr:hypothetical protein [Candidatus Latescibacterota bacterium]
MKQWLPAFCIALLYSAGLHAQVRPNVDFDESGAVDYGDFLALVSVFGSNQARFDLNGSGVVDFQDFIIFVRVFAEEARGVRESIITENAVGSIRAFSLPTLGSRPIDILADTRGIVWFTEIGANQIGRMDTRTGSFIEYAVPSPGGQPHHLAVDSRGNIWFTEIGANQIGRLDPISEELREFSVPTPGSRPYSLTFDRN